MLRRIDRSPLLSRALAGLSASLAKQRGLLAVIGVLLVLISFVISLVDVALPSPALEIAWSVTHHLGIIIALIGILLIEPLGR